MIIPILPVTPSGDYGFHTEAVPVSSALVSIFGFVLLGLVKSLLIGAFVGRKCGRTKCCISRHFLKAWCSYKYKSGQYRQCRWQKFCQHRKAARAKLARESEGSCPCDEANDSPSGGELERQSSHSSICSSSSKASSLNDSCSSLISSEESSSSLDPLGESLSPSESAAVQKKEAKYKSEQECGLDQYQFVLPRTHHTSRSSLLDMARMQDWSSILTRIVKRPKEAKKHDSHGLFPLHWACSGNPPSEVVKALLEAYPQGAHEVDMEGSTALHFLMHYGVDDPTAVEILLQFNPSAAHARDVHGRTPLYHACDSGISIDVLRVLLPHSVQIITQTRSKGKSSPLSLAWKQALKESRTKKRRAKLGWSATEESGLIGPPTIHDGEAWNKALLLLQVAHRGLKSPLTTEMAHRNVMLHSLAAVNEVPIEAFQEVVQYYPEQVQRFDEAGNLPLVSALSSPFKRDVNGARSVMVIQTLLDAYPQAVFVRSSTGQLPLFIALDNGRLWEEGVQEILQLNYEALWVRDPKTKLYAFMLAACRETTPVSSSYERRFSFSIFSKSGSQIEWTGDGFEGARVEILNNDAKSKEHKLDALVDEAHKDILNPQGVPDDQHHLTTIYELLRACPAAIEFK